MEEIDEGFGDDQPGSVRLRLVNRTDAGLGKPLPAGVKRTIGYAQDGVTTIELMERCFDTGAEAVLGWRPARSWRSELAPSQRPVPIPSSISISAGA